MPDNPTASRRRRARPTREPLLVSLSDITAEYGLPYNSARDLVIAGELPAVRFPGRRRIWVKRSDVLALIERSVERGVR